VSNDVAKQKAFTVLITGCSSGIGRALAEEFLAKGHQVFASARVVETLEELKARGAETLTLDVLNAASIENAVKTVIEKAGKIDILVNNAGYGLMGPMAELEIDAFRLQLETNVVAPLAMVKAVVSHMVEAGSGRIVNVGSVSGLLTTPFAGAYCASKSAIHAVTDALRLELTPLGIKVISLQPGAVLSNFGKRAANSIELPENSMYEPVKPFIEARAKTSQNGAMDAAAFAKKVVAQVTSADPPPVIRLGPFSTQVPMMKWLLPVGASDKFMNRRFGLANLKK
jgi:NAD(P)-dependent dehydrogenase (short-subunit alcohol dehydrogenase family)